MTPGEALTGALNRLYERHATEERVSFTRAAEEFGGNSQLAQAIAGTSDKQSHEYKSAMRTVQRYIKGESGGGGQTRGTKRPAMVTLRRSGKAIVERKLRAKGVTVEYLEAEVTVSDDTRYRSIPAQVSIGDGPINDVLDHMDAGDADGAAAELLRVWTEEYGLPEYEAGTTISDMESLVLGL